jgi:nucleoid-associated protein YgaU
MGIFDFVKNAGKKVFSGGDDEYQQQAAASDAKIRELRQIQADRRLGDALKAEVAELGIAVEDLRIEVAGGRATVKGGAPSQADREKIVLAVGNVKGVAQVEDLMEVSQAEPEAQFYTVQAGDSLSKIAKQFYGNAMKYPVIFEANKPMLTNPDKIYPGQVLRIPPQES